MYETVFHKQSLKNYSFLITGGSGFIGSNIVAYLMKHHAGKVRVLDNLSTGFKKNIEPYLSNPNFEFIEGDITDVVTCRNACAGIHFVSHQAALGSVPRSIKDPLATHAVNATGFLNMLVAAQANGVRRFVYASSSSVYGDHPALPKREEDIGNPLSPYAASKIADELYAGVFSSVYDNLEIIGLRYFNIFGPNQSPDGPYAAVIPLFIEAVKKLQAPFIDGDGDQTRDFTFVKNAVQANILAMFTDNREAVNQVYNVAAGEQITVNKVYDVIAKLGQSTLQAKHRDARKGDVRHSLADISKAQKLLGYQPLVKAEEGLRITFDWFSNAEIVQ